MGKGQRKVEASLRRLKLQLEAQAEAEAEAEAKKAVHTEDSLLAKTNSELKTILASYDGAPAANGKKKSELVEAILAEQAK
jgi:regulator of protease activity HflC (stomatin/prohibitin superfamily)